MAFDSVTRNRLQRFVSDARTLLTKEFTRQLQNDYGIDPSSGEVAQLESMSHLDNVRRETGRILRVTLEHYRANSLGSGTKNLLERIVREQAFTVLNRLAALRMAEAREFLTELIANGYNSQGFQLYARLAGTGLGETGDAYRCYLFSLFDEFALDLRALFDRFSPLGRLFPGETALLNLLKLMNDPEIADLWAEDETIGWIYQYFNSKDERKKMRDESAAPRNSRELAVRNQFFTPRYVVEFLTDNTLGRIWYEMTQGKTALRDRCSYLVRRPTEIFLEKGAAAPEQLETDESLSQEELLKQTVYIPHRPLKDPREIRMLDPACGSMHFGLYAFDLYECIYEEAWDLEERGVQFQRHSESDSLMRTYASKEAFLRDVPRLIIEHNIHGVDIDPRAVQIAGLSLWLRSQKSWQTQGLKLSERPQIQRSNIVCAEPMPGEERLLDEFIEQHLADTPEQQLVGQLVRRVFEAMKLAGEAGSLLQIEQEISKDIEEAKLQWLNRPKSEQLVLLTTGAEPKQQELPLLIGDITDEYFWERIEGEIYKALNRYAEQAENGNSYQRRLFTYDTARGFAFIDLCRKKFDVALMNPPFGDASLPSKSYIEEIYGDTKGDVYKTFVECFQGRLVSCGMLGIISSRAGFLLGQSTDWRERVLLRLYRPLLLADLGYGVLDAMVETAAYVLRNLSEEEDQNLTRSILPFLQTIKLDKDKAFSIPIYQKHRGGLKRYQANQELERLKHGAFVSLIKGHYTRFSINFNSVEASRKPVSSSYPCLICIRLLEESDPEGALLEALNFKGGDSRVFVVAPLAFIKIPSSPFAYWISNKIRQLFTDLPIFENELEERTTRCGLGTLDDFRFLRLRWEVDTNRFRDLWFPYYHGGTFSPIYDEFPFVVKWENNGLEVKSYVEQKVGSVSRKVQGESYYFQPGFVFPRRTRAFSPKVMPSGGVFSTAGQAGFLPKEDLDWAIALLASAPCDYLVALPQGRSGNNQKWRYQFEVGLIKRLPWVTVDNKIRERLSFLMNFIFTLKRSLSSIHERSSSFLLPLILEAEGNSIASRFTAWLNKSSETNKVISKHSSEINDCVFDLYNISEADFGNFDRYSTETQIPIEADIDIAEDIESEETALENEDTRLRVESIQDATKCLISYGIGIGFGHWDARYSVRERTKPILPNPFDPLPACSPGMFQDDQGLPAKSENISHSYPIRINWSGVSVDEEGNSNDLIKHFYEFLDLVWSDKASDIEQEICEILSVGSLRDYFRKPASFFNDHLSHYSERGRQAPIYLPLSTRSGSYTLWLYYHRLTDQTLYTCINDYVEPKLSRVSETVNLLRSKAGRSRDEEKSLENLQTLESELIELRDELLRVARLPWKPNLSDGVQITVAPLYSLFRLGKWQKKLKETWEKLEKGDYDWAHLAYSIWTKRVREKCRTDKSLAIAHNLEDLYEPPPETLKRTKRKKKE